jgi:tRNA(His) 5'-end guanylyltransferase
MVQFVGRKQATALLKMGSTTLKKYRALGYWIEGIHWVKLNSRCVRYNVDLIQDWLQNRTDPAAHQKAIANYQASLLSNQPQPKKRKSG